MIVFTEEWLSDLESKYGSKPRYMRPGIYFYGNDDECSTIRDEIENWIRFVPDNCRANIISRLRSERHFEDTYFELYVAYLLAEFGCQLEYEKPFYIDTQTYTPDWVASTDCNEFAVEVLTIKTPKESQRIRKFQGQLFARLRELPVGAHLKVNFDWRNPPQHKKLKNLIKRATKWVCSNPKVGEIFLFEEISITLNKYLDRNTPVFQFNGYVYSHSLHGLDKKIENKFSKYKQLELPLIICVVPTFDTQLDIEDAQNVILGTHKWRFFDDDSVQPFRERDGLYTRRKPVKGNLSSIFFIPKRLGKPLPLPSISTFPNPNTDYPLPIEIFRTKSPS